MSILSDPRVYIALQTVIGAKKARFECVREYVRPQADWDVLDIGCGPGYMIEYYPGTHYVGLDVNQVYIDYARRTYGHLGNFICQRFDEAIVDQIGSFDLVIMNGLLHHLSDSEATNIFQMTKRVLKPGGKIFTLDGCLTAGQSYLEKKLMDLDRGKYVRTEAGYLDLVSGIFTSATSHLRRDLLFVPYTLILMEIK